VGRGNPLLNIVKLRNNLISGPIPDEFWLLPNLYSVDFQNNE
jgi:hypothetical protein